MGSFKDIFQGIAKEKEDEKAVWARQEQERRVKKATREQKNLALNNKFFDANLDEVTKLLEGINRDGIRLLDGEPLSYQVRTMPTYDHSRKVLEIDLSHLPWDIRKGRKYIDLIQALRIGVDTECKTFELGYYYTKDNTLSDAHKSCSKKELSKTLAEMLFKFIDPQSLSEMKIQVEEIPVEEDPHLKHYSPVVIDVLGLD
jgi:hypothetical protein